MMCSPPPTCEQSTRSHPSPRETAAMHACHLRGAPLVGLFLILSMPAFAQKDPGVRGGFQNTAGALQQKGIPIPHPSVISPNPTTGATITANELASFKE